MRFFTTTAVAVAAVRVLAEVTVRAATCPVEAKDKCRCSETGNVTTSSLLDIGCYFKYPYDFDGVIDETTYTYRFSPCQDTECEPQTGAVCQYAADLDRWFVLGRTTELTWTINSDSPLNFTIQYGDGEVGPDMTTHRKTLVTFIHSESSETKIEFIKEYPQLVYHLQVTGAEIQKMKHFSPCTRKSQAVPVGIVGTVLLCLALVGIVTYFVVGVIINYKMKGARGTEVIPNVSFWKGLPILIKDGVLFTLSPCISRARRTSGYDNI